LRSLDNERQTGIRHGIAIRPRTSIADSVVKRSARFDSAGCRSPNDQMDGRLHYIA
jgi:hypothetical protein